MIPSKLRSRKGASLTVALLLLLVCATVGSIILTAATANIGRISERAKYDRKYYAVTSAARLFADEVAGTSITLTIEPGAPIPISRPADIQYVTDKLQANLQHDIYSLYTGGQTDDAALQATASDYWYGNFSRIGDIMNAANAPYCRSAAKDFTITIKGQGDDVESTVYGRFAVEASRIKGDPNPGLDSVAHNVVAVFYSDIATNDAGEIQNDIPESAYVVRLVCPADSPPAISDNGVKMDITFQWRRENMQITQVRGGA